MWANGTVAKRETIAQALIKPTYIATSRDACHCEHRNASAMSYGMPVGKDFQTIMGPGDRDLMNTEISGYAPPNRHGEIIMNAFIDPNEWTALPEGLRGREFLGRIEPSDQNRDEIVEHKPLFYEWATVQPGLICVTRKKKQQMFRRYAAAQAAAPVISCCACLKYEDMIDWSFVGIARTKSVRAPDDGQGPDTDEFFTLSLGGIVQLFNSGVDQITNGDLVEWTFVASSHKGQTGSTMKRRRTEPRRIGVRLALPGSPRLIGRSLSYAGPGQRFDLLIKQ